MSNQNAPFGFKAVRRYDGAAPNFANRPRDIAYNYATKIYSGDPVKELSTGYIALAGVNDVPVLGIFDGCEYMDTVQNKKVFSKSWPASSSAVAGTVKANIIVDPMAVYEVRSNGAAITIADVGANAKYAVGTGNDVSGLSGASIDASTLNTTNTLAFRVVGLSQRGGNDNTSSYNIVEVVLVQQAITSLTGV